jgi:hypothetical protein
VEPPSAPELSDDELAREIELLGVLVLAASRSPRHLTQDEVDEVLRSSDEDTDLLGDDDDP